MFFKFIAAEKVTHWNLQVFYLISRFFKVFCWPSPGLQVSISRSPYPTEKQHFHEHMVVESSTNFLFEMTKKQVTTSLIANCDLEKHLQLSFYISSTSSLVQLLDFDHCLLPSSVLTVTFEVLNFNQCLRICICICIFDVYTRGVWWCQFYSAFNRFNYIRIF